MTTQRNTKTQGDTPLEQAFEKSESAAAEVQSAADNLAA